MKYIPKLPDADVNIPKTNILKDLIFFLSILLIIIISIYMLLGLVVDVIVEKIPPEIESKLGYSYISMFESPPSLKEKRLQKFLDELVSYTDLKNRKFKIRIFETKRVNALAMPGGNIIVFSGLIEKVKTENQLAYVLSHELGHYAHKDHLRAMGRGLVLSLIAMILFGSDTFYNKTMSKSLAGIQLKYSREQEIKADLFAVEVLNKKYNNVAGITELLEILGKTEPVPKTLTFFTTHPHYTDRISSINKYIKDKNYKILNKKQNKLKL